MGSSRYMIILVKNGGYGALDACDGLPCCTLSFALLSFIGICQLRFRRISVVQRSLVLCTVHFGCVQLVFGCSHGCHAELRVLSIIR
ncbi:hypothetical protein Pfo_014689 [Paulownia fortunei]|nr:hypothetical protein Pfo_014689 [Paulownia fortunei]